MTLNNYMALGAGALLLTSAADLPAERVVQPGETVPISVNGQVRPMRIEPGASGLMLLSDDYARAAGLKGGKLLGIGVSYVVGNERVMGSTAVARVGFGSAPPQKRRVGWTIRPYAAGIDAVIGPAGLDEAVVRFVLHPSRPGERTATIPMASGGLSGTWFALRGVLTIGGDTLTVRFDPYHARSVVNALAGERLAAALGGRFDGAAFSQEIAFGIERPVRPMALARPFEVGPLTLSRVAVRTVPDSANGGSTAGIKEATDPEEVANPDDVVVTAKRRQDRRPGTLTLGADMLDRCSSIVFDKPRSEIRLTCG